MKVIKVGSRDSFLAVAQTKLVMDEIQRANPEIRLELVTMKTTGDKILNKSLDKIGGKGLFVKELDDALLENKVDITVHSLKDMPMELNPDLPLVALSKRGDPRDALVLPQEEISSPQRKVGTSSLRRKLQLKGLLDCAEFAPVRGNIITRIKKLDEGNYTSLILAASGLERAGLQKRINRYFDPVKEVIPAAGQAVLAVQGRKGEDYDFLKAIHSMESQYMSDAERSFVTVLDGGCSSPVAAYAQIDGNEMMLTGLYYDEASGEYSVDSICGNVTDASSLGVRLAEKMRREWE